MLSVVGFHTVQHRVPGGFVGVDVFFVISGFLISSIVVDGLRSDRFSLAQFYRRRVLRIFPALLLTLVGVCAAGWIAFMADEYRQLGRHVASAAGFVANIALWRENGYFDNVADTKPLLHLWSLGIEEQFYVVYPLVLWIAWKLRLSLPRVVGVLVAVSFAFNIGTVRTDLVADFYSPLTRAWELMAGGLLAMTWTGSIRPPLWRHTQSAAGLILIVAPVFLLSQARAFPGWWALLPVLGTLLAISAGAEAWVNRVVLSSRALVWVGLISYPLYLWHWVLLTLPRVVEGQTPPQWARLIAIGLSVLLAWMTYRFVERPIRGRQQSTATVLALACGMVAIGAFGFICSARAGFPLRAAANPRSRYAGATENSAFFDYQARHFYPCTPETLRRTADSFNGIMRCFQSKNDRDVDFAIVGDSHAESLFAGLSERLANRNVVYYERGALPTVNSRAFDDIFRHIMSAPGITTVVLSAYWSRKAAQTPTMEQELQDTTARLIAGGKRVYLLEDVPTSTYDPKACKYQRRFLQRSYCDSERAYADRQYGTYVHVFERVAASNPGVEILETAPYFCNGTSCSMVRDGTLLYRDEDHLNIEGSKYLGRMLVADHPRLLD